MQLQSVAHLKDSLAVLLLDQSSVFHGTISLYDRTAKLKANLRRDEKNLEKVRQLQLGRWENVSCQSSLIRFGNLFFMSDCLLLTGAF